MTHYEKYMEKVKDKYGLDHLETEREKRTIELPVGDSKPSKHDRDHIKDLKDKFGVNGLDVEIAGLPRQQKQTVEDFVIDKEREAMS